MLRIPVELRNKLIGNDGLYVKQKLNTASCNILFEHIKSISNTHSYLDRLTYQNDFLPALSSIDLVTDPQAAFIPRDDITKEINGVKRIWDPNRLAPEYIEITKRIPLSLLEETYGPTNALVILAKADPKNLDTIYDDIYIYFMLFKWLDQINLIRLTSFSNYCEVIEYVVDNITYDDWKTFLKTTSKINIQKYASKCEEVIFNPEIASIQKFYKNHEPKFDAVNLMMRLVSNVIVNHEMYLVFAVYLIMSCAVIDLSEEKTSVSKCMDYVNNVLSKL